MKKIAAAIDLGSTFIKAAVLGENGLVDIKSIRAPQLKGEGLIREYNLEEYITSASLLLQEVISEMPEGSPVGIASQRSTFLLWNKTTGIPATPLISWQDCRASKWCIKNQQKEKDFFNCTGLLLSPHYAGPKLAYLFSEDEKLKTAAYSGELLFGTLETYFIWRNTGTQIHQTDPTMAARTLLADSQKGEWSDKMLNFFGVPKILLPKITPTIGKKIPLNIGGAVTAAIADQAAALITVAGESPDTLLVNLGTGGFVLYSTGNKFDTRQGYLAGPYLNKNDQETIYAIEGTINGIGNALIGLEKEQVVLSEQDPAADLFCLPDTPGIGSPYWLTEISAVFSVPEQDLKDNDRKRVIMEGIIFRVTQIINDLCKKSFPPQIYLSGGLAEIEFIAQGLASCLEYPVVRLKNNEATLLGAVRAAVNKLASTIQIKDELYPQPEGRYLKKKYLRWEKWFQKEIEVRRIRRD